MNNLPSLWPGIVASYDRVRRTARVRIPGLTDGSDVLPEAVFSNPLGDRADITEIRIDAGDAVWLMFEGGDPRFPIIMGYRTPREGNPIDWRRWRHANIELTADGELVLNATTVRINADAVHVAADGVQVGANTVQIGADTTINGELAISGGSMTHNGTDIGGTHTHSGVEQGLYSTGTPN